MNKYVFVQPTGRIMGRLPCGCDLLQELTRICIDENIVLGRIEALGVVFFQSLNHFGHQRSLLRGGIC